MKRKAIIDYIAGSKKEFYYLLRGDNGEILADSESFTRKQSCLEVLKKYFPTFEIVDLTKKSQNKPIPAKKQPNELTPSQKA